MIVLSATVLVGTVWAEPDKVDAPIPLAVELSDGSRLIGIPVVTSISTRPIG